MDNEEMEHVKIFATKDAIFGYHGWPSVCRGVNNELLAVCSGKRLGHVCPFGKVMMSRSYDEGRRWTAPEIIMDTPLDDRDAGVTVFNKNMLIVTSFNHLIAVQREFAAEGFKKNMRDAYFSEGRISKEMEDKYYGSTYVLSDDAGITWSEVMHAPVTAPHGPTALKNGGLIYMGNHKESCNKGITYNDPLNRYSKELMVYRSSDGIKWEYLSTVPYRTEQGHEFVYCEPYILELDNKLVGFIRVQGGVFDTFQTESSDSGKTWSVPRRIVTKGSPPHALRHSSGAVVLVYGYRSEPFGQRAKISYDDCVTWSSEVILRDDGVNSDLGYPCSAELKDHRILTVYYQKENLEAMCEIFGTTWTLPEKGSKS
jgi:hypothetical protein